MINILVIGDIMIDNYVIGIVDRISPEAPVPIVKKSKGFYNLGGCGNVINNLAELDCQIYCKTIIGRDFFGDKVIRLLSNLSNFKTDFIDISFSHTTTVKERIIAEHRYSQLLRIDTEITSNPIKFTDDEIKLIKSIGFDIIIISDYNKGVITNQIMEQVQSLNIPYIIDPKPEHIHLYKDAFVITPNEIEFKQLWKSDKYLDLNSKFIIRTMGNKGIDVLNSDGELIENIPSRPVEVFNVSGAGDTVISILSYCIAQGNDIITSCKIANECAHYVVTKPGTSVVPKELFETIYIDYGGK